MLAIISAQNVTHWNEARALFLEYAASLEVDLAVQGFQAEQATLPGKYAPPRGGLLLAYSTDAPKALGTVAIRPFEWPHSCEVKRLYVRPEGRGTGTGRLLMSHAITFARQAGYRRMLLDTLPSMDAALELYRSLGFEETGPYWASPLPGVRYFCKKLA